MGTCAEIFANVSAGLQDTMESCLDGVHIFFGHEEPEPYLLSRWEVIHWLAWECCGMGGSTPPSLCNSSIDPVILPPASQGSKCSVAVYPGTSVKLVESHWNEEKSLCAPCLGNISFGVCELGTESICTGGYDDTFDGDYEPLLRVGRARATCADIFANVSA